MRTALNLGGQTADCFRAFGLNSTGSALDAPVAQGIRDANNVFPFDYTGQPFQANMRLTKRCTASNWPVDPTSVVRGR